MSNAQIRLNRMKRELELLQNEPPHGISAWPKDDRLDVLEAKIQGPEDTAFEDGVFKLEITIPERYPFDPPSIRFITPIYHPNIDNAGRICLDILNMPPKGVWSPSLNLSTALTSIRLLMAEPNPDDGLMAEITEQYKNNRQAFLSKARETTLKYAIEERNCTESKKEEEEETSDSSDSDEEEDSSKKRKLDSKEEESISKKQKV